MTTKTARKNFESASVKKLPDSSVEITATIAAEAWQAHRAEALANLNKAVSIDGFRKGAVPENILIAKIGEMAVLEEMAELAVPPAYVDILMAEKIDAIGRPSVRVTKIAAGSPLEFTATTAVVPTVSLPDYATLAREASASAPAASEATDADIEEAIMRFRKAGASHEGHDHSTMTPEEHDKAIMGSLPEFNDEFVRGLGGDFTDIEDFKTKARAMIGENKKDEAREKRRLLIADAILAKTEVELPAIMVESELDRTQSQFEADIERMGVKIDDYLKHAKKSLADIRGEWRASAEKKAKLQLILNEISKAEKLSPSPAEIEAEVDHIAAHYKDADRERAAVYAETVLTNEKVFKFLEDSEASKK